MIARTALRIRWRKGMRIRHARGLQKRIGLYGATPCLCSCWMCGNPRRFNGNGKHGLTMQERKAMEAMGDE